MFVGAPSLFGRVFIFSYQERDQRGGSDVRGHPDSQWYVILGAEELHSQRPRRQELLGRGQSCC